MPLIMGCGDDLVGGKTGCHEFDLLISDSISFTLEQQIRSAEIESLKDLRQQQMNQKEIQTNANNNNANWHQDHLQNQVIVEIEDITN